MKISYNREENAAYFTLTKNRKIVNSAQVKDGIILDFDKNKKVIGLEIISPSNCLSTKEIKDALSKLAENTEPQVTLIHDRIGETLTIWFQTPIPEESFAQTRGDIVYLKNTTGEVIGIKIINFNVSPKGV